MKELLQVLDDDMIKCVRCGMCHAHDTLYLTSLDESLGTRGRMVLINAAVREGVEMSDGFVEKMFCSLGSYDPQDNCPTSTRVLRILARVRERLLAKHGVAKLETQFGGRVEAALTGSSAGRQRVALLARVAATELPSGNPWSAALAPATDPSALAGPALDQLPDVSPGNGAGRVGYLLGAWVNYTAPQVAEATVKVLNAAGYEVVIPKEQRNGGELFAAVGDLSAADDLTKHNAQVFADLDTVVTSCAATGAALKNGAVDEGTPLSEKVKDVTELLAEAFTPDGSLAERVAYHDDSRLRAGMGVSDQPKALLAAAAGDNCVALPSDGMECGDGGETPFSLLFPELAQRIVSKKSKTIIESKADLVATGNVSAMHFVNEAMERAGAPVRCRHTVELLAQTC